MSDNIMAPVNVRVRSALRTAFLALVPPNLLGALEYQLSKVGRFDSWKGPMNGQTARLEIAREIIENCKIETIVETGTFRGTTTAWFSQFSIRVLTAEISPRYASFAASRLSAFKLTKSFHSDSLTFLRNIVDKRELEQGNVFVYLDAHWYENLPLRQELEILFRSNINSVIMIDDFEVKCDQGYGFDKYSGGRELTLRYIQDLLPPTCAVFFPSVRSSFETGAKRGCVVIASDCGMVQLLDAMPLLRRASVGFPKDGAPAKDGF
jgi:hypothetical protein